MDPFEPDGGLSSGVKLEAREFNTRPAYSPSAYPHAPPPRVKQEESDGYRTARAPSTGFKQESSPGARRADLRTGGPYSPEARHDYGGGGYPNRANGDPPGPSAFPRGYPGQPQGYQSYNSNHQAPLNNYPGSTRDVHSQDAANYPRQATRTLSPPPRAVKRERDYQDDLRPYPPANDPPIKRERSGYSHSPQSNYSPPNYSPTRDPRLRAKIGMCYRIKFPFTSSRFRRR
ncbi:hypothetical protein FB451DRAFT_1264243 [Mycena latifolia]|nr:hypothetical protein FB451DRAFT_1264243 [Mycena latifolia]